MPRGWLWWRRLLFLSVTGNILPFILIAWAERSVPSGEVGLVNGLDADNNSDSGALLSRA